MHAVMYSSRTIKQRCFRAALTFEELLSTSSTVVMRCVSCGVIIKAIRPPKLVTSFESSKGDVASCPVTAMMHPWKIDIADLAYRKW